MRKSSSVSRIDRNFSQILGDFMRRSRLIVGIGMTVAVLGGLSQVVPAKASDSERYTYCVLDDFTTSPKTVYFSEVFRYNDDVSLSTMENAFEEHIEDIFDATTTSTTCAYGLSGAGIEDARRTRKSRIETERVLRNRVVVTVWQYSE